MYIIHMSISILAFDISDNQRSTEYPAGSISDPDCLLVPVSSGTSGGRSLVAQAALPSICMSRKVANEADLGKSLN
jgi:hypothetical protein